MNAPRRRRKKVGDVVQIQQTDHSEDSLDKKSGGATIRHEAVTDQELFAMKAEELLVKVQEALRPLKSVNDPFVLTKGYEEDLGDFLLLDLGPVHGQYTIQIDNEQKLVLFQSPISGAVSYILSASTNDWRGDSDGHIFEGLLVRDLIRQINGVPNL